jgi:hypothetical protein
MLVFGLVVAGVIGIVRTALPPSGFSPESKAVQQRIGPGSGFSPEQIEQKKAIAADGKVPSELTGSVAIEIDARSSYVPQTFMTPPEIGTLPTTGFADSPRQRRSGKAGNSKAVRKHADVEFIVPTFFQSIPPPLFVMEMAGNSGEPTKLADVPGLTASEETAVEKAGEMFFDGLTAAPTTDPDSAEYSQWWDASQQRSESYLRAMLGWSRYNTLNAAAAKAWLAEISPPAPAIEASDDL